MSRRNRSPSLPVIEAAAAATARFCGESILPSTPADELVAAMSTGLRSACFAAVACRSPNSAFEEVSEPVIVTPSHPITGESSAKKPPVAARACPRLCVWPEKFMT